MTTDQEAIGLGGPLGSLDPLHPALRDALRAEAYRVPVRLSSEALAARAAGAGGLRLGWPFGLWPSGAAAILGIVLVVAAGAQLLPGRPGTMPPTSVASPTPDACDESSPVLHGSWWSEVGGPNAFFNIETGGRPATANGERWLLIVRADPDGGHERAIRLWAEDLATGERIDGTWNSRLDPANIFRFDEPAPSLPGGWYLFEQEVPTAGCWRLHAEVDGREAGAAIVEVRPGPALLPGPGATLAVEGTATECFSIGGCAYFMTLSGDAPPQRLEFEHVPVEPPATQPPPGGPYQLRLDEYVPPPPGRYHLLFEAFWQSDAIVNGTADLTLMTTCSVDIELEPERPTKLHVTFSEERCDVRRS